VPDKLILVLLKILRPLHPAMIDRYIHYITSDEGMNDYALDSVPGEQAEANIQEITQSMPQDQVHR